VLRGVARPRCTPTSSSTRRSTCPC
jgi:hypothetical protein